MANAKPENKVKIFRENTDWGNVRAAAVGLAILLAAISFLNNRAAFRFSRHEAPISCQDLPDNFESKALPRQIACWRLKLNPNEFSGKVILPENVGFTLRWQTAAVAQIRNGNGEILTIDPRVKNDLGRNPGNLVMQFKGQGAVLIAITECL